METFREVRFWLVTALLTIALVRLMTYPKMHAKAHLAAFVLLSLVATIGFRIQIALLRRGFIVESSDSVSACFLAINMLAVIFLVLYVVAINPDPTKSRTQSEAIQSRLIQSVAAGSGAGGFGVLLFGGIVFMNSGSPPTPPILAFAFGVPFAIGFFYQLFNLKD